MRKNKLFGQALRDKHCSELFKQMMKGDVGHIRGKGLQMRWVVISQNQPSSVHK